MVTIIFEAALKVMIHLVTFNLSHSGNMYICFLVTFFATPYPSRPVLVLKYKSVAGSQSVVHMLQFIGDKANQQYTHRDTAYFNLQFDKC